MSAGSHRVCADGTGASPYYPRFHFNPQSIKTYYGRHKKQSYLPLNTRQTEVRSYKSGRLAKKSDWMRLGRRSFLRAMRRRKERFEFPIRALHLPSAQSQFRAGRMPLPCQSGQKP